MVSFVSCILPLTARKKGGAGAGSGSGSGSAEEGSSGSSEDAVVKNKLKVKAEGGPAAQSAGEFRASMQQGLNDVLGLINKQQATGHDVGGAGKGQSAAGGNDVHPEHLASVEGRGNEATRLEWCRVPLRCASMMS